MKRAADGKALQLEALEQRFKEATSGVEARLHEARREGSAVRESHRVEAVTHRAGVIERTGSAVDRFKVGDRVTFDSTVSCGKCEFCRQGHINLCDNRMVLGVSCGDYRRHGEPQLHRHP